MDGVATTDVVRPDALSARTDAAITLRPAVAYSTGAAEELVNHVGIR